MKALKIVSKGQAAVVDVPKVSLRPTYILVKTVAVALNPTDWKHRDFVTITDNAPPTIGCDFAGIVEEVGSEVTRKFKPGDRVFAFLHGSNVVEPEDGSFGEYLVAKGDIAVKIPDNVSFEEGSTLGVAVITVGQGLYQKLQLPWPTEPTKEEFPILIYGGSSAMGMLGIQFAKLSGLEVITTCSPHNFDFVKSLGASAAFDYNSPTVSEDIRAYTNNKLRYVWDTISEGQSPKICANALSSDTDSGPLYYGSILSVKEFPRDDVERKYSLGYTVQGEKFVMRGQIWEARPEDFEFTSRFTEVAEKLLEEGKFKPHTVELREGGLEGIIGGMEDLKNGKVSGKKLVYRISDP